MGLMIQNDECTIMYRDFFQKLASTLMKDDAGNILGFNIIITPPDEVCDCEPVISCDLNHIEPAALCAMHGFAIDNCGRLALKLTYCTGGGEGGPR